MKPGVTSVILRQLHGSVGSEPPHFAPPHPNGGDGSLAAAPNSRFLRAPEPREATWSTVVLYRFQCPPGRVQKYPRAQPHPARGPKAAAPLPLKTPPNPDYFLSFDLSSAAGVSGALAPSAGALALSCFSTRSDRSASVPVSVVYITMGV